MSLRTLEPWHKADKRLANLLTSTLRYLFFDSVVRAELIGNKIHDHSRSLNYIRRWTPPKNERYSLVVSTLHKQYFEVSLETKSGRSQHLYPALIGSLGHWVIPLFWLHEPPPTVGFDVVSATPVA